MERERVICCCGASTWAKVIAWFQIIGNVILSIMIILSGFVYTIDDGSDKELNIMLIVSLVFSLLGIIMGVILLKGTNDKRVGFLKVWLIYGAAATLTSITSLIIDAVGASSDAAVIGSYVFSGLFGIAINVFSIVVVYIHMKEIEIILLVQNGTKSWDFGSEIIFLERENRIQTVVANRGSTDM